ncbi:MAG: tRNA (adenosine(37)-N6)-threonylcarbamoyltransferase complex ATPase subunit type 1 TsaE [Methylococcales bacterium]
MIERLITNEEEMYDFGAYLHSILPEKGIVYLNGQLGAGKTTLVRAVLKAAGYRQHVKSPTYTIVEDYLLGKRRYLHFDLYRLADPEELEWLGMRDYLSDSLIFIEWAERGKGFLPDPDLVISLVVDNRLCRRVTLSGFSIEC